MPMIKIQPFPEPEYFYQPGDIVIGRCVGHQPWPGVIRSFYGYDEDEVQVYNVDFFQEKSYAFLETYLITPLSEHIIRKMRSRYHDDPAIMKALMKAERALRELKVAVAGDPRQEERFRHMYHRQADLHSHIFEDVQAFSKQAREHRNLENVELMPKIEQYFIDKAGNKKKSKEYIKRKLALAQRTINISVLITPHQPQNTKLLAITIQEGLVMTYTIFKRIFEKQPLKERTADELSKIIQKAMQDLKERKENDQRRDLEVERGKDEDFNLKISRTTRLIS